MERKYGAASMDYYVIASSCRVDRRARRVSRSFAFSGRFEFRPSRAGIPSLISPHDWRIGSKSSKAFRKLYSEGRFDFSISLL